LSFEVTDIISKFLRRDPSQRLQQADEIKSHPWFSSIDWEKLMNLQLEPPFKPNVRSEDDVSQIGDDFLNEDIDADDDDGPRAAVGKDDFINFTFAGK